MALLVNAVKTLFEAILAVSNEAGVLRRPSRVGCPLVVEDRVAQLIAATAGLEAFL
jgi:hypothetical protein